MAQNFKPIIDEIKSKLQNREQIRDAVLENLKQTRETVEKTLKQVAEQTKDSKLVTDYVIPFVESEKADQALRLFNDKLGNNPVVTKYDILNKIEKARKSIIDLKVAQARNVEEVTPSNVENVSSEENVQSAAAAAKDAANALNDETQKL